VKLEQLRSEIISNILWPVFEKFPFDKETEILVNPSGRFVKGGPDADTGLTGRKLMVDTYGGLAHHGGGALSGKDPTKVDRSGAYMARYIARNIVSCGLAKECEVSISYAIGKADPVAFTVDTFGTGKYPDEAIRKACLGTFNMRPAAIIEKLRLRNAGYEETATYGHFNGLRTWENSMYLHEDIDFEKVVKKYAD
jgi:S-adenosylmethionine synthetase